MKLSSAIIILIGMLLIGCKTRTVQKNVSGELLDSIDYTVIKSAILQYLYHPESLSHRFHSTDPMTGEAIEFVRNEIELMLLIDSTIQYQDSIAAYIHNRHSEIDKSDSLLTENLIEANKKSYKLSKFELDSFNISLISRAELTVLLDSTFYYGYGKLFEKHPTAYGIISVSKPAYNLDRTKAILYISFSSGPTSGTGDLLWLKKEGSVWNAYDLVFLWVS